MLRSWVQCVGAVAVLVSCDAFPRDSAGTWNRVQADKVLRVGVAAQPPWVVAPCAEEQVAPADDSAEGARPGGVESQLVEAFAQKHGLRVAWAVTSQIQLAEWLHARHVDVGIGGFEHKTPLKSRIALSQPFVSAPGADGKQEKHVIAVIPGESRMLFEIDRFLLRDPTARSLAAAHGDVP